MIVPIYLEAEMTEMVLAISSILSIRVSIYLFFWTECNNLKYYASMKVYNDESFDLQKVSCLARLNVATNLFNQSNEV